MKTITLIVVGFLFLKQITIGGGFNFIKYFRNKKEYWKMYNDWLSKKP